MKILAIVAGCMAACGGAATLPASAPPVANTPTHLAAAPAVYPMSGTGNGVYWDAVEHTLYLTDDASNRVMAWVSDTTFSTVGTFQPPAAAPDGKPASPGLGGLVRLPDGTFLSPVFGFGNAGGIAVLPPGGAAATQVPGLDPAKRRIALARAEDGTLYATYFTVTGHDHSGGVETVSVTGQEHVVLDDLVKPVGVVATRDTLYVADQDKKTVFAYARGADHPPARVVAANLPSCDQLTLLPNGDLVTGGKAGALYRIKPDGTFSELLSGLGEIRGSALDAAGGRLFFVEHVKGGQDQLHIIALP